MNRGLREALLHGRLSRAMTIGVLVALAVGTFVLTASAQAERVTNGGGSIATAPSLPLDQTVASGWSYTGGCTDTGPECGEFWALQMNAGDQVVIDASSTSTDCSDAPIFDVYAPSVTDFTISQTNPVVELEPNAAKYEYRWVAPSAGQWRLFAWSFCNTYSYTFSAVLQLFTTTTLKPPPTFIGVHHRVRFSGSTTNGAAGPVLLAVSGPHRFKLKKLVQIVKGRFGFAFTPTVKGRYYVTATYGGDTHHRPSRSKRYKFSVI